MAKTNRPEDWSDEDLYNYVKDMQKLFGDIGTGRGAGTVGITDEWKEGGDPDVLLDWFDSLTGRPSAFGEMERNKLPLAYWGNQPGIAGVAQFASMMRDPYNFQMDDSSRRESLEANELAHNRAGNRARMTSYRSGGEGGGVQRMSRGNIDMSRGAGAARSLRDWDRYKQQTGDRRVSMLMPWLDRYNQAVSTGWGGGHVKRGQDIGIMSGYRPSSDDSGSNAWGSILGAAGTGAGAYFGGPLGAAAGGGAGRSFGGLFDD